MPTCARPTLLAVMLLIALLPAAALAHWVDLGGQQPLTVTVLSDAPGRTVYAIDDRRLRGRAGRRSTARPGTRSSLPGESALAQEAGLPALPDVRRALIIPDDRAMRSRVLDVGVRRPAGPAGGPVQGQPACARWIRPRCPTPSTRSTRAAASTRQLVVGRATPTSCATCAAWSSTPTSSSTCRPSETLRVYTRLVIEVADRGPGPGQRARARTARSTKVDPQFARPLRRPLPQRRHRRALRRRCVEDGGLLIIAYDAFAAGHAAAGGVEAPEGPRRRGW